MKKLVLTIAAVASAATAVASPAAAKHEDAHNSAVSAQVHYADLNLTTAEGQATLQARVDKAARDVCKYDSKDQIRTPEAANSCYRNTRQDIALRMAEVIADHRLGG